MNTVASPVDRFDLPGLSFGQVVEHLRNGFREGPYERIALASEVRGNVLWVVEEIRHRDKVERKICAYVLEQRGKVYGFRAYYEGRITQLTVPLSFLDEVPARDPEWREMVRQLQGAEKIPA